MKKILIILFITFVCINCSNKTDYIIGLKQGDFRKTETEHYILIEKCIGFNAFNEGLWTFNRLICKDSIGEKKLHEKLFNN